MNLRLRGHRALAVRVAIYVVAIVVLAVIGGRAPWDLLRETFETRERSDDTLVVSGTDLCPGLADVLLEHYGRDHLDLEIERLAGGNDHALEALLNHECDVAFLVRSPSPREQELAFAALGDSLHVLPIARGALEIVATANTDSSISLDLLRSIVRGQASRRLYAPAPSFGLFDLLCERLGIDSIESAGVVFLAGPTQVLKAVENDPEAIGLHWSLGSLPGPDLMMLGVVISDGSVVRPDVETIADGSYPLAHALYLALTAPAPIEATMFATHVHGGRGQRQIERTGAVPDRLVLREVHLNPDGDGGIQ